MQTETFYGEAAFGVLDGSSLKGYVKTTRADIEKVFGEPTFTESGDGKTTVEWVVAVEDEDGTIFATIYDWKRYELGTPAPNELMYWNIGGFRFSSAEAVAKALGVEASVSNWDILER